MYFKSKFYQFLYCFILITIPLNLQAQQNTSQDLKVIIEKIEIKKDKNIAIHLNKKGEYKIFTLSKPNRLIFEISNGNIKNKQYQLTNTEYISKVKFSDTNSSTNHSGNKKALLVTFFLTDKFLIKKTSFDNNKNIIFCQLADKIDDSKQTIGALIDNLKDDEITEDVKISKDEKANNIAKNSDGLIVKKTDNSIAKYKIRNNVKNISSLSAPAKKPIIVIDAGHGGKDPGAIGVYARTKEKNITLSYAKELAKHLMNKKKYKVLLTRDDDYFIPLDKRVDKSRRKKADLFISLHANIASDHNVSGFSIYTLSEKSSDKKAELLAQKENQADIINGIDFSGASKDIAKTLIDLSQRDSKNNSARLAQYIIREAKKMRIEILQNTHRFAGFMVLTAPDMASVLIELGYLSNKNEEEMLNSSSYRRLVAKTLGNAIDEYFKNFK